MPATAAAMTGQQILSQIKTPQHTQALLAGENDLGGQVGNLYNRSTDLFGTAYNAELTKAKADNARQQKIFDTGTRIAMAVATGGQSELARAGMEGVSGNFGGGLWDSFGGGGGSSATPNYSGQSYGRHSTRGGQYISAPVQ